MPGFISESERLHGRLDVRSLQEKVGFQEEDKAKAKRMAESKLAIKRLNQEQMAAKIQIYEQEQMTMATQKVMAKAGRLDNYEKVFHLFH